MCIGRTDVKFLFDVCTFHRCRKPSNKASWFSGRLGNRHACKLEMSFCSYLVCCQKKNSSFLLNYLFKSAYETSIHNSKGHNTRRFHSMSSQYMAFHVFLEHILLKSRDSELELVFVFLNASSFTWKIWSQQEPLVITSNRFPHKLPVDTQFRCTFITSTFAM